MDDYYVDEYGFIVCRLDGSRFVSMSDFNGHKRSFRHRKRVVMRVEKPKKRKVNPRSKIFNY